MKEIYLSFELRLNIESWGKYKKGDIDLFTIPVINEQNGLVRWSIDKRWDILSVSDSTDHYNHQERDFTSQTNKNRL